MKHRGLSDDEFTVLTLLRCCLSLKKLNSDIFNKRIWQKIKGKPFVFPLFKSLSDNCACYGLKKILNSLFNLR